MRKSNGILTLFIKRHQAIINILNHIEPIFKVVSRFGMSPFSPYVSRTRKISRECNESAGLLCYTCKSIGLGCSQNKFMPVQALFQILPKALVQASFITLKCPRHTPMK